jgi:hypothetical protein
MSAYPPPANQPIKRLFWDIETSPNISFCWRAGPKQFVNPDGIIIERKVICIGFKWEGDPTVHILFWDKYQNDKQMLQTFLEVANEADELVAHWGDSFDMPWFRTRCVIHGLQPLPDYKTVDTCAWASRLFAFNSNKLDYIAKLLGIGQKIATNLDLWKKVVLENDRDALLYMGRYCAGDVADLLEPVWNKLRVVAKPKTHAGVSVGLEKWTCAHCGDDHVLTSKKRVTAQGTVQWQMKCRKCGAYYTISDKTHEQYLKGDA